MPDIYRKLVIFSLLGTALLFCLAGGAAGALAETTDQLGRGLYALGDSRQDGAVDILMPYLEHRDPTIRRIAAHALGKIGDPKATTALLAMAGDDTEEVMVRCAAVRALGKLKAQQAQPLLRRMAAQKDGRLGHEADQALVCLDEDPRP